MMVTKALVFGEQVFTGDDIIKILNVLEGEENYR